MSVLSHMFRPRSVAVIGASRTRTAQGNVVLANLKAAGFGGTLTVVHPTAASIDGVIAVPSISKLPEGVDVAIVCVPASHVAGTLAELDKVGCPTAISVAAGFTESEDEELRGLLHELDIKVGGPNCMGLIDVANNLPLYTARHREELPVGTVAVIAQSGSAAIALTNYRGIGFSKIITSGNEYGVTAADYIDWLATDPDTQVVGLVAESVRDPLAFEKAVHRLHDQGKSIVVLKVGRSSAGATATTAHTRAIVGDNEAYSAYFRRIGVPTVRDYDELGAALQSLSISPRRSRGSSVGILSISGGQGALACDVADEEGISLAELSRETSLRLRELLPGSSGNNPLDLGASLVSREKRVEALKVFADDDAVDAVVVMQDAQDSLPIHADHDYLPHIRTIVKLGAESDKPVVLVSSTGAHTHPLIEAEVNGSNVPLLRGLRPGLAGLRTLMGRPGSIGRAESRELSGCPTGEALEALQDEIRHVSGTLPHPLTLRLLRAYGIRCAQSTIVEDERRAVEVAEDMGYPLVVKVVSPGLSHKTEAGGVETDIRDASMLRDAVKRIRDTVAIRVPGAPIEGFELQDFVAGDVEAVVGFTFDPSLGPLVVIGTGGVLVELENDHQSALAPISETEAEAMIGSTRIGRLLGGYRSILPATDLTELSEVVRRVGRMASDMAGLLVEGDLNPVVVNAGSGRSITVDALLVAAEG